MNELLQLIKPELFWNKVDRPVGKGACWLWKGAVNPKGYGTYSIRIKGKTRSFAAHRVAFWLTNGYLTPDLILLHGCDTPRCCNPTHLKEGTHLDNSLDKIAKGRDRHLTGEQHKLHKLTWEIVAQIRTLYGTGSYSATDLGKQFSVDKTNINQVVHNKTWHDPKYIHPVVDKAIFKAKKLTREDIAAIRSKALAGISGKTLAETYGIAAGQVSMIISNKTFIDPNYTPPEVSGNARYAKVTAEGVRTMREAYKNGVEIKTLQEQYTLGYAAILAIINNQRWFDPDYTPPEKKRGRAKNAA